MESLTGTFSSSIDALGPVSVTDPSGVGEARRAAQRAAQRAQLSTEDEGRVALVVTELATNLTKHAGGGAMLFQPSIDEGSRGVLITAFDRGRGMDVHLAMRDGHSSSGTAGNGLGAIRRMSDSLDIHSLPDRGTIIVASIGSLAAQSGAGIAIPLAGEEMCGDAWAVSSSGGYRTVLVVDGLGHGPVAAEAARVAVEGFAKQPLAPIETILRLLHGQLRPTRGAALAIARVDERDATLRYAGIGNISGVIASGGSQRSLISHNGIVGHEARKFQEFVYPWTPDSVLIMHSDGLSTQWKLDDVAGLRQRHPAIIAAALVRDFSRGRDDASAFVLKSMEPR